jgi:pilus assembly protein Flp/PilA
MRNLVMSYLSDETGAAAAEYALILAIVGAGIAVAALSLGHSISTRLEAVGTCISSGGSSCT